MSFTFAPATREQAKARIALAGPSGSGKTFTALSLGKVLGDRMAVIDTEHGSASKYAVGADGQGFVFDALNLTNFSPQNLVAALAAAGQARYPVVIVDSLSHFWSGVGGMLEQADNAARKYGGNSFAGWKDARPMERQLVEALLAYPGHVIVTMRSKTEYVIEENERGRKTPRKIGMKPEQRDGIEYEFDVVGDLDVDNTLMITKTRCSALAGGVIRQPGEQLATTILEWLSGGTPVVDTVTYIDRAVAPDLTLEGAQALYREIEARGLLGSALLHPDTAEPTALGPYLLGRGKSLRAAAQGAPVAAAPEPVGGAVRSKKADPGPWETPAPQVGAGRQQAAPAQSMDQPGAVKALREAAAAAGLTDKDLEEAFETAYGTPVADASLGNLTKMTATLRGAA
jgi:hypothetical protein